MRLLTATIISLMVCLFFFLIIKLWGNSQLYIEYKHPFYADATETLIFKVLTPQNIKDGLKTEANIYLNVGVTLDKKLIVIDPVYEAQKQVAEKRTSKFQSRSFDEIKSADPQSAVWIEDYKEQLQDKRIIFNLQDNPLSGSPVFIDTMKNLGFEAGNNFIYISAYDPPAKDLKELQPTYLFGTTNPEILRLKAMESLFILEAATFRADIVIHPLTYYNRPFYTETLLKNIERRFKKVIIGPISENEKDEALKLKPLGIILN